MNADRKRPTTSAVPVPREDATLTPEQQAKIAARAERRAELDFWNSRRVLRHLYRQSRVVLSSPWTLLGGAILRVMHTVPYHVQYRSAIGPSSLNTLAVFVADSGGGKSIIQAQLNEILNFGRQFVTRAPGSGEAIAETYVASVDSESGRIKWRNPSHAEMFAYDEVGTLVAMKKRGGSTVLEYFKMAWSGSRLGRVLVGEKGVELPEHEYRMTAFINAQHERAHVLLNADETAGGFPGRVLWFNTQDPLVVKRHRLHPGEQVKRLRVRLPEWPTRGADGTALGGIFEVMALPQMNEAHVAERESYHLGKRDAMHGHELMVQVRVAIALMALDGRVELNDEDWALAEAVMNHSRATRTLVRQRLAEADARGHVEQGRAAGRQKFAEQEAYDEEGLKRARVQFDKAVEAIQRRGENVTIGRVKKPMTDSLEKYAPELLREWQERQ